MAAGQQELQEPQRALARFEAALYIFEITGDPALKAFVEANFEALTPKFAPSLWEIEVHEALLRFARIEGIAEELRKKVRSRFVAQVRPVAARFAEDLRKMDPYRAPIPQYTWGSNKAKAMQARLFQLVAQLTDEPDIRNLIDTIREIGACDGMQIVVGAGVFNRAEGLAEEIGAHIFAPTPMAMVKTLMADSASVAAEAEREIVKRRRARAA